MRQFYHYWTMPQLFLCLFVHVFIYSCVHVYACDLCICVDTWVVLQWTMLHTCFDTLLAFTWPFEACQILLCPLDRALLAFNAVVLNLPKAETL